MGGMIPLSDASRQPGSFPVVTIAIIVVNAVVFVLELMGGAAFVMKWSEIPATSMSSRVTPAMANAVSAAKLPAKVVRLGAVFGSR